MFTRSFLSSQIEGLLLHGTHVVAYSILSPPKQYPPQQLKLAPQPDFPRLFGRHDCLHDSRWQVPTRRCDRRVGALTVRPKLQRRATIASCHEKHEPDRPERKQQDDERESDFANNTHGCTYSSPERMPGHSGSARPFLKSWKWSRRPSSKTQRWRRRRPRVNASPRVSA